MVTKKGNNEGKSQQGNHNQKTGYKNVYNTRLARGRFFTAFFRELYLEKKGYRQAADAWHQKNEIWVIPLADAVIEHSAVVIETHDAVPAITAM